MHRYRMLIENHFVYRNNDEDNNLLGNSYSLNGLEDNERKAMKRREIVPRGREEYLTDHFS